jgi:predicted dehydrogenase
MSDNINKKNDIWLIGAGYMATEYAKVLEGLKRSYTVIGKGRAHAEQFRKDTGHEVIEGGIQAYLAQNGIAAPAYAIVTANPDSLKEITIRLIELGVKEILVEKPAGLDLAEIAEVSAAAAAADAHVYVAYNRRFYASVLAAQKMIEQDGGVTSFDFEFTEWIHTLDMNKFPPRELANWFMANSTHVVDLAFYLGGEPADISCYVAGAIPWYTKASCFSGAGLTKEGVPFSYKANWESAGRWVVEALTKKHKFIFAPLEKLQIQNRGSVKIDYADIDDSLDTAYKPGLYLQTQAFLNGETERLLDIEGQKLHAEIYEMMEKNSHAHIDHH